MASLRSKLFNLHIKYWQLYHKFWLKKKEWDMICTPWYFRQAVFHILCGTITVKHDPLDHEKVQRLILSGDFMSVADALLSKHVEWHFVPLKKENHVVRLLQVKTSWWILSCNEDFLNIKESKDEVVYQLCITTACN